MVFLLQRRAEPRVLVCLSLIQISSHRSISSAHSWARYRFLHWADQRRADRLGHPVEADNALAGTAGRERLGVALQERLDVLPVVAHPDVAGRIDVDIDLHL